MITKTQLLELIINQYQSSKSLFDRFRDDSSEIRAITELLQDNGDAPVYDAVFKELWGIFLPLLTQWNVAQKPSATLSVLPVLMNTVLKNIEPEVDFNFNLSLEDIYTIESYSTFRCGEKTSDDLTYDSYDSSFYLYVKKGSLGNSTLCYDIVTPQGVKTAELFGKKFDSIKSTIQHVQKTRAPMHYGALYFKFTDLTLKEINLLMHETSKRGHFPDRPWFDENRYCRFLLKQAGLTDLAPEKMRSLSNEFNGRIDYAKSCLTLNHAKMLTPENSRIIARILDNINNQTKMAQQFVLLENAGALTAQDKRQIAEHQEADKVLECLAILHKAGIITTDNRKSVLTQYKISYDSHISKQVMPSLAEGLVILAEANILNEKTRAALIQCMQPGPVSFKYADCQKELANLFKVLNKVGLLSPENIEKYSRLTPEVLSKSNLEKLSILVNRLQQRHIPANFVFMLENSALLTGWSIWYELQRLPEHLLTQDVWNEIVRLIQHNNENALPNAQAEEAVSEYLRQLLLVPAPHETAINTAQSTHTASVHKTISESATRLIERYGSNSKLPGAVAEIIKYVKSLPNDTLQNRAAKACIVRLTADDYAFTDPTSQVSTRQLLGLSWLAIHDNKNRATQCSLKEGKKLFVEGLYEIQRGYNLSETEPPVDDGAADYPICIAGTFNKLMEKLHTIHPDVEVLAITKGAALEKLPQVVREEAQAYLTSLLQSSQSEDQETCRQLLASIDTDPDIGALFERIKPIVLTRMFDEYGSLFKDDINNPSFISFINNGKLTDLGDLSSFRKQTEALNTVSITELPQSTSLDTTQSQQAPLTRDELRAHHSKFYTSSDQRQNDAISKAEFARILNAYKSKSIMGYLSTFWIFSWISPTRSQTMIELKSLLLPSSDEEVTRTQIEAAINRGDNKAHRLGLFKEELGHVKNGTGTDEVIVQLKAALNKRPLSTLN